MALASGCCHPHPPLSHQICRRRSVLVQPTRNNSLEDEECPVLEKSCLPWTLSSPEGRLQPSALRKVLALLRQRRLAWAAKEGPSLRGARGVYTSCCSSCSWQRRIRRRGYGAHPHAQLLYPSCVVLSSDALRGKGQWKSFKRPDCP